MKIETLKKIILKELRMADVHPIRQEQILRWIDIYEEDNMKWWQTIFRKKTKAKNEKQV